MRVPLPATLLATGMLATQALAADEPVWLTRLVERASRAPLVIAHRGDAARCPENTLSAFRGAVACGADLVELDARLDGSGRLVCLHDGTLDRTTDVEEVLGRRDVRVEELTAEELARLDAGSWKHGAFAGERIPTLTEALELLGRRGVPALVERKSGPARAYVEALGGGRAPALLQSFDWDFLEEVRRLDESLPLVALGSGDLSLEQVARLERIGVAGVHWQARDLDLEELLLLRKRGFLVFVYTVDDDLCAAGAAALGVDGITTNDPARIVGRLREGWFARSPRAPRRRTRERGAAPSSGGR